MDVHLIRNILALRDLALFLKIPVTLKTSTKYLLVSAEVRLYLTSGAYGEVRKCLHKETKALRAVKIINKKFLEQDEKDKL